MSRVSVVVFVGVAAAVAGWLALHASAGGAQHTAGSPPASAPAVAPAGSGAAVAGDAGGGDVDSGLTAASDAGGTLLDGAPVPALDSAPKSVRFGVVLVRYAGAQGAKPGTRSRAEAAELAAELAELGRRDFAAAVHKGDSGSVEDAGHMFRAILEPAPEYVLFSLDKGAVSDPVDTPRGYWVVKRLE